MKTGNKPLNFPETGIFPFLEEFGTWDLITHPPAGRRITLFSLSFFNLSRKGIQGKFGLITLFLNE